MVAKDIIDNQSRIHECACAFRRDANFLMAELSKKYNFSLTYGDDFGPDAYKHKRNNKGELLNDWTFYFHGTECRFDNLKSGQIVEVILMGKPEFGYLDGNFFFNYMCSTEKFKDLANWFGDYSNVWEAIEVLADNEILKKDTSVEFNRNIIAA